MYFYAKASKGLFEYQIDYILPLPRSNIEKQNVSDGLWGNGLTRCLLGKCTSGIVFLCKLVTNVIQPFDIA
jgi:hypothetical protein